MVKDIICLIQGRNSFDSNKILFGSQILSLNQTNLFSECKEKISSVMVASESCSFL